MRKAKLFIDNFIIYGIGGIISKIIPLIMVPIITRLMPGTEYYGVSDMSNTIISFAQSFAVFGMYEAMYRMFFEKDDKDFKKSICSTTLVFNLFTSFVVAFFLIIFRKELSFFFLDNAKYSYVIVITAVTTFVGATNSIVSAPTRMMNKRKIFLITNSVAPIISYLISVPLILKGYYVIAMPLAAMTSGLIMEVAFIILNIDWFDLSLFDLGKLKEMLKMAVPLLPTVLVFWIFGSCDRIMITRMLGISEAGVYAVGAKLGLASQLIYTAFAGGWQYFAYYTMKEDNQVETNSKTLEYLAVITYLTGIIIFVIAKPFYYTLFEDEYARGFIVAPYLYLAPLIQMLYQIASTQFMIIKKTWPTMILLTIGALANMLLNYVLIPYIGIEGAAIASLLGYSVSLLVCIVVLDHMNLILISRRMMIVTVIMIVFVIVWRGNFANNLLGTLVISVFAGAGMIIIYYSDIMRMISKILIKIRE